MMWFVHDAVGARVVFGTGRSAETPAEVARTGSRPIVIADDVVTWIAGDLLGALGHEAAVKIDHVR